MKITKYEHACLVIEDQGEKLVIDPGDFTKSLPIVSYNILVICDVHFDHLGMENIKQLIAINPEVQIFAVDQAQKELKAQNIKANVAKAGQKVTAGTFELEFFGGQHAIIHPDWPKFPNLGVLVNNKLYYPGDSFVEPNKSIEVLAIPNSGPWHKLEEAITFLLNIKPKKCFSTHDALLSKEGIDVNNHFLRQACEKIGISLTELGAGESVEI